MTIARKTLALAAVLCCTGIAADAAEPENQGDTDGQAHRDTVMSDLFAVISLNGQPCQQVVDYQVTGPMQYVAICKNGKRYRVGVTPDGRVQTTAHNDD